MTQRLLLGFGRRFFLALTVLLLGACSVIPGVETASQPTASPDLPSPTATPNLAADSDRVRSLSVEDIGFVQDGTAVDFGFVVENLNVGMAIEGAVYRMVAYAADETALGSATGRIARVAPETLWGVGGRLTLEADTPVTRLDVRIVEWDPVRDFPRAEFTVERVTYFPDARSPRVTGVIRNPYRLDVTHVHVSVLVFDEGGAVLTGSNSYIDFIPGDGVMGVDVGVKPVKSGARVAIYPSATSIMSQNDPESWPEGAAALVLLEQGFVQQERQLVWMGSVANPSDTQAIRNVLVALTVYDRDGAVLAAQEARLRWLLAGQQLGIVHDIHLPEGQVADRVTADLLPMTFGAANEADKVPILVAETVTFEVEERYPRVHARVVNDADRDMTQLRVVAILRDEAGVLVGGGGTFLEFVPAQGQAAVSVRVTGAASAATDIALSAYVSALSNVD